MNNLVYIIAEAGVNHNGSEEMAFQLVDAAVEAGADAVKFQTFKTENIVTRNAVKAKYQQKTTDGNESQFDMLKKLELPYDTYYRLQSYCIEKNIQFLSTAFDIDSLEFLVKDLGVRTLKIPSGEITNGPFLLEHAKTNCNLILSTGMATIDEVQEALCVIAFGLMGGHSPSKNKFRIAYNSDEGQKILKDKVALLHCTTEYPAPLQEINLNAMGTMYESFGLTIGYSDHTEGIIAPIVATAIGAKIIEKHFTLDKNLPGPDHKASLNPIELKSMVTAIRSVPLVMGDGIKKPSSSEIGNRNIARKSIVAASNIAKGDIYMPENLTFKRPGNGVQPMEYWDYLGRKASQNFKVDEQIE